MESEEIMMWMFDNKACMSCDNLCIWNDSEKANLNNSQHPYTCSVCLNPAQTHPSIPNSLTWRSADAVTFCCWSHQSEKQSWVEGTSRCKWAFGFSLGFREPNPCFFLDLWAQNKRTDPLFCASLCILMGLSTASSCGYFKLSLSKLLLFWSHCVLYLLLKHRKN